MKSISNLIPDIQAVLQSNQGWYTEQVAKAFNNEVTRRLNDRYGEPEKLRKGTLRLSKLGPICPKALWYSTHFPELAEALPPSAEFKYTFGHLIEGLVIALAREAGHEVLGEQDELILDDVKGHRDCVIDGCTVDVKSSSSRGFLKFKTKDFSHDDSFGYLDQLDAYVVASHGDPLVKVKDRGYIFAVDKQLGSMVLYSHEIREAHIRQRIADYKAIINLPEPPACKCRTVANDTAGNIRLAFPSDYSAYKHICFPFLRTFIYSSGPVFFSKVVRPPVGPKGPLKEIVRFKRFDQDTTQSLRAEDIHSAQES